MSCFPHTILASISLLAAGAAAQSPILKEANRTLPLPATYTGQGVVADFDGDGSPDLFLTSRDRLGDHRLYLNDGNGAFLDASSLVPSGKPASAAAAGDVDGDGDIDLLLAVIADPLFGYGSGGQNQLLLNDGTGSFVDASLQLPTLYNESADVALVDVDGDGDLDAVIANIPYASPLSGLCSKAQNRLYLNDGTGNFSDRTDLLPLDSESTRSVVTGDIDFDGDVDLLMINDGFCQYQGDGASDRFYINDGTGDFRDVQLLPPDEADGVDGLLADLDGDGDLDIWIGNDGEQDKLFRNEGHLIADVTNLLPPLENRNSSSDFGDVDGDGLPDLLIGGGGTNLFLRNTGGLSFVDASAQLPSGLPGSFAAWVELLDVDGDGDEDALFVSGPSTARLALNDGAGNFVDATETSELRNPTGSSLYRAKTVSIGDVDGDGDEDVLLATYEAPTLKLYLNEAEGRFTDVTATNLPNTTFNVVGAALEDFDGDGDLDLLVTGGFSLVTQLFLNDGTGVFASVASGLGTNGNLLETGDVDGDGDVDLLLRTNALFLNQGDATFVDASGRLPSFGSGTFATFGDVDGDGDLDLFVGRGTGDKLLFNDGNAFFSDESNRLPAPGVGTVSAAAMGDVDGDGDLDLFLARGVYPTPPSQLYLNDGAGNFEDASSQVAPVLKDTRSMLMLDIDGDGDLDVIEGNSGSPTLYENDGSGVFSDGSSRLTMDALETYELAAADLDGDGDLDIVAGGEVSTRVWDNLTRHVAWRALTRAGKPLDLEVSGTPNEFFAIAYASSSASIPLRKFGLLRLEPSSLVVFTTGVLDADGNATVRVDVPASVPIGATLFVQALVGSPLRLTNLQVTVISPY